MSHTIQSCHALSALSYFWTVKQTLMIIFRISNSYPVVLI